jgi:hypothetical protein
LSPLRGDKDAPELTLNRVGPAYDIDLPVKGRIDRGISETSNHIHLLVKDTAPDVISPSMQLIGGRTAQDYNRRKVRKGAFWEDRYHATAIEADSLR